VRKEFVMVKSRKRAVEKCPWASFILKSEGGYWCFESLSDYQMYINQR